MLGKAIPGWAMMIGAAALSVAMVTAFTDASTGARTVTASVVTDANAYLALAANANSPHDGFVSVSNGKATLTFDNANLEAAGDGINPEGAYEFDNILKITNQGSDTAAKSVDIAFAGTDSTLCQGALTTTETAQTHSADPSPISLAKDATGYLGIKVLGTGKTAGQSVSCTITVTAS